MTKRIRVDEFVVSCSVVTSSPSARARAVNQLAEAAAALALDEVEVSFSHGVLPADDEAAAVAPPAAPVSYPHEANGGAQLGPDVWLSEDGDTIEYAGERWHSVEGPMVTAPGVSTGSGQMLQAHVLTDRACRSRAGDAPIVRDGDRCYLCRPSSNGG